MVVGVMVVGVMVVGEAVASGAPVAGDAPAVVGGTLVGDVEVSLEQAETISTAAASTPVIRPPRVTLRIGRQRKPVRTPSRLETWACDPVLPECPPISIVSAL